MTPYLAVFFTALAVSLVLTPLARRLSFRWRIVAEPGGRRRHKGVVPKLGGLPLFAAYLAGIGLTYWLLPPTGQDALRLQGVVLGSLVVFLGGLLDDRLDLPAAPQFLIQIAGAAVAMAHLVFIEVFSNPFPGAALWTRPPLDLFFTLKDNLVWMVPPLALFFTLAWALGMINAVNWLDGLDGLAAGVGTIAALLFAWHSYRLDQMAVAAFPLALAGALLGFLPYNFAPARIFLGTAGAYLLGYNLATLSILSPAKLSTALLVLALPILDGVWRVIDRLRQGRSPLQGDRGHLHFRLQDSGLSTRWIVVGYYGVAIAFGLIAVAFVAAPTTKLLALAVLGVGVLAFLVWFSAHGKVSGVKYQVSSVKTLALPKSYQVSGETDDVTPGTETRDTESRDT
ncbi:MAG: undecaprenyl/decaprenyl-phosphate alpha-N-acetylglucosaminyl 1-phosphate transferase [Chloroflexi bacterium]|nr:undecaprenyl/decaprenyl-phosphate alpha-N-acetylglucosaminyl 1-phosphate transferase [Chloroflexota bacterium]MCI0576509.1 undecaprenyl/decaprenyl-phosphate alpha-N-acetylglucosaminyl 1-phosphate transferase [Chloroflexota bacterium]MCI0650231.1 undecaprenyl/decaprenyl-phosphate alpha-N-acetylglucosaminyl 1-phosphate transferase [Chloroflexota bacterium]MCI0729409.1 undecaprenyl/decaprenyl-phosphate alpha-N-acetylglucosaminyl 1-phosphate transferase [Chloroflexota bacterium]